MSSKFSIRRVSRRRLYEDLVDQLVQAIVSGDAPVGTQLPSERELVEQFGAGRSSVREALFALQKMGLIALNNGERATVIEPTSAALLGELSGSVSYYLSKPTGVKDFQGAREFFETGLSRHAASNASVDDIENLKKALEANREALGDINRFIDTDVAFHYELAVIAGNPIFTTVSSALSDWLRSQRTASVEAIGSPEAAIAAHTKIFKAIAKHDPDAAEKAMRDHLQQVVTFYWAGQETKAS